MPLKTLIHQMIRRRRIRKMRAIAGRFRGDRKRCERLGNDEITRFVFSAFSLYEGDYRNWPELRILKAEKRRWKNLLDKPATSSVSSQTLCQTLTNH